MCWRWEVSLASASLELACGLHLWRRRYDVYDKSFALFMWSIATMESLQGLLWVFALDRESAMASLDEQASGPLHRHGSSAEAIAEDSPPHTPAHLANLFLSFVLVLSAWVQIPLAIVNFVPPDGGLQRKRRFQAYLALQYLAILAIQYATGIWTTLVGPNGHQVWPCAAGLGALHLGPLVNTCILGCLLYISVLAWALLPLPGLEFVAFTVIGALGFGMTFFTLGATYEACSVWCWSAGFYGLFFLERPAILKHLGGRSASIGLPDPAALE